MSARKWAILGLFVVLVFDVWWRCHTIGGTLRDVSSFAPYPVVAEAEPLDCDEAIYAYIGKRLAKGDVMYRDLTENKPPLGYWIYALTVAIGGANETTIRLMPLPFVLVTIVLVWSITYRIAGAMASVVAAAIYAMMSTDPYVYGNGANMEHFVNLFATAGLWWMIRAAETPTRRPLFIAGICVGAAALVKQVAIVPLFLFLVAPWLWQSWFQVASEPAPRATRARSALFDSLCLLGGFLTIWAVAAVVLIVQGAAQDAVADIVRYGGALAADTPPDKLQYRFLIRWIVGNTDPVGILPWPFGRTEGRAWWAAGCWPLWALSLPVLVWSMLSRHTPTLRLVGFWTLAAWLQVAMPGLFWQHYYMLPLPGIAVLLATALAAAIDSIRTQSRLYRLWAIVLVLTITASIVKTGHIQVRDYLLVKPNDITTRYKGGGQWVVLREVGRKLADDTREWSSPHLAVWGIQSPLYFYSGLDGVTRQVFTDPLIAAFPAGNHPQVRPRMDRTIQDYKLRKPELVFVGERPFTELHAWLVDNYTNSRFRLKNWTMPFTPDGRGLWVRRDRASSFAQSAR